MYGETQVPSQRMSILVLLYKNIIKQQFHAVLFCLFVWFDSLRSINNLSVKQGRIFLGWTSIKLG